ncbi:MAG TPA: hypothetical protein VE224_05750 [Pseudolabrys sp.]|nr:hypothetical protein [Pseudolabrys sp.]
MRTRTLIRLAVVLTVAGTTTAAFAASEQDFKTAYGHAETAAERAVKMKTAWTTTEKELKAAKKAAAAGKYDDAVKRADHAKALADASIAQAEQQAKLWHHAVPR